MDIDGNMLCLLDAEDLSLVFTTFSDYIKVKAILKNFKDVKVSFQKFILYRLVNS